ncbi:hypothetical protein HDC92_003784 [Pedobacter sp. AK017]|uniref:hypothetical protein n=1 Tax=Pedobacter sp. AK017 TaxID=2723073 RepID=UPI001622D367|nr:hypothetical protein [Pedobacter sp. AK017]MBB5440086.1 hypothetical protein [Pedobacter sp. AK017]
MKRKPKVPVMPKLSKSFMDELVVLADGVHGRPFSTNFAPEWEVSVYEARYLLQLMLEKDMITIKWQPEKEELYYVREFM